MKIYQIPVKKDKTVSNNQLWFIDRSGSMYRVIDKLIDDVVKKIKALPLGTVLTIYWYSSENGDFGNILRGYKLEDYKVIEKMLQRYKSVRNLTCFSEVIADSLGAVEDMSALTGGKTVEVVFFTDGCPVVNDYQSEIRAITSGLQELAKFTTKATMIGYGSWYDRSLMAHMANVLNGTLVHADNQEFTVAFEKVGEKVTPVKIDRPEKAVVFTSTPPVIYTENSFTTNADTVYVATDGELSLVPASDMGSAYALAMLYSQQGNTAAAINVLSELGDKHFIDQLYNAFTNDELGQVEKELGEAIHKPEKRFQNGRESLYGGDPNQYCLLDLFDDFAKSGEVWFHPYHSNFNYKKIGPSSKPKPEALDVRVVGDPKGNLGNIVFHRERLNLSIGVSMATRITMPENNFGITNLPSKQYRNYTIIKDGTLNVTTLPVSFDSVNSFNIAVEAGVIDDQITYVPGTIYTLDLTKLPVANRSKMGVAAGKLAKDYIEANIKLASYLKVAKDYLAAMGKDTTTKGLRETYGEEVYNWLTDLGIKDYGYSMPMENKVKDYYEAPVLKLKVKGYSSLPSVNKVKKRLAEGKKPTNNMFYMREALQMVNNGEIEGRVAQWKEQRRALNNSFNKTKFAVMMAKQNFAGLPKDGKIKVDFEGRTYVVEFVRAKERFPI